MNTLLIHNNNNTDTSLDQVYEYLKGLDLLEKVSGYEEILEDSWNVDETIQKQVGDYWVDIKLYAFWKKDSTGYPELKEFLIEDVTVYKDKTEVLDWADCVIHMNNPMYPSYGEECKKELGDMFKKMIGNGKSKNTI